MGLLLIIAGCLFLLFDIALLKKKGSLLYEPFFYCPRWETVLGVVVLFLAAFSFADQGVVLLRVAFLMVFSIYVLRRQKLLTALATHAQADVAGDERLDLALSTFSILGLWALVIVAASLLIESVFFFLPDYSDELTKTLLLSEISVVVLLLLIYRAVRLQKGLRLMAVLGLETHGLGVVKVWVFPALFAMGYAAVTAMVLDARAIQPMTPLQELLDSAKSLGIILFFVGTAILSAPFFEEVIFRGFLFYVLRSIKGVIFAVVFVALLFGALHVDQYWGDSAAIMVVGLFGLILTVMRAWTGSAVPGMVAHYVYNISMVVFPVIMVLGSNPTYFDYQMNYYRLTNEQKEERLLASIKENPKFATSYNDLAWLYSEQGVKLEQALELIDRALELEPRNYAYLDTKAEVLFKMKRESQAIAIEEDLVRRYPQDRYLRSQLDKFQDKTKVSN